MDHLQRVKREFSRQAERFATAAAITDEQLTARFVAAADRTPQAQSSTWRAARGSSPPHLLRQRARWLRST